MDPTSWNILLACMWAWWVVVNCHTPSQVIAFINWLAFFLLIALEEGNNFPIPCSINCIRKN